MRAAVPVAKRISRLSAVVQDRLARSSRVFLLGILIACGIEVAVDWNSTLSEITVLRDRMRERGRSYVGILCKSAAEPMKARDAGALEHLAAGLFDDDDVVFVRFADVDEHAIFERLTPAYGARFERERGKSFAEYYAHQLDRDTKGMLNDPEGLRSRMENSRHRDFAQAYNDFTAGLARRFVAEAARPAKSALVLYQDRLYTMDKRATDQSVTYAIGRVDDRASGKSLGVVVVAFSMDRTNDAIAGKYLKGAGIVVFFVALILVQNVLSRKDKLRLLDLEASYSRAKEAIAHVLPAPSAAVAGAISQTAAAVDGLIWDTRPVDGGVEVLVVDPQGDGIDAAAVALHVQSTYRKEPGGERPLADAVAAAGKSAMQIPLARPIGILLLRVRRGTIEGIASPIGGARVLEQGKPRAVGEASIDDVPEGIVGPLRSIRGDAKEGSLVVIAAEGLKTGPRGLDVDAVSAFVARAGGERSSDLAAQVGDAVTWARGKTPGLAKNDLLVIAVPTPSA